MMALPDFIQQTTNADGSVTLTNTRTGKTSVWKAADLDAHLSLMSTNAATRAPPVPGIAFLKRFTDDEYKAIDAAAAANIQIKRWRDELLANGEVNVNGEEAQAAKAALVATSLLTPQRAELVFAAKG